VLYIGFASDATDTKEAEFKMEEVCINSNELYYQREEDYTIKVKCISMLPDNTKLEAEAGDPDGIGRARVGQGRQRDQYEQELQQE